jgi:hypothetical protein
LMLFVLRWSRAKAGHDGSTFQGAGFSEKKRCKGPRQREEPHSG